MTPPEDPATDGPLDAASGDASSGDAPTTDRAGDAAAGTGGAGNGAAGTVGAGNVGAGGAGDATADVGARFAEGLARVAALDDRPLAEHADAYQHLHTELQAVLTDVDSA